MSYILEALKRMEKKRQRPFQSQFWSDVLTAESQVKDVKVTRRVPFIVAFSIFFGVSGILIGLFFSLKGNVTDKDNSKVILLESIPGKNSLSSSRPQHVSPMGQSLNLKKAVAAKKPLTSPVKEKTPLPIESELTAKVEREDKGIGKDKNDQIIDLTDRYRLTSTGELENRKYATIDRKSYTVGSVFMDMIITDIGKDRVYLKRKQDNKRHVITFRYKIP